MKTHIITARSYRDLKSQLYPWENNLNIRIKNPAGHISKVLSIARQEEARWKKGIPRPSDWNSPVSVPAPIPQ